MGITRRSPIGISSGAASRSPLGQSALLHCIPVVFGSAVLGCGSAFLIDNLKKISLLQLVLLLSLAGIFSVVVCSASINFMIRRVVGLYHSRDRPAEYNKRVAILCLVIVPLATTIICKIFSECVLPVFGVEIVGLTPFVASYVIALGVASLDTYCRIDMAHRPLADPSRVD